MPKVKKELEQARIDTLWDFLELVLAESEKICSNHALGHYWARAEQNKKAALVYVYESLDLLHAGKLPAEAPSFCWYE